MKSPFNQPLRGIRSPFGATTGNGLRVTAPALYFLSSAQPYTITGGNTISVADTKSAGGTYGVAISISSGALTLSGITGLSFSVGDGTADAAMTFTGSLTNINNALANSIISSATAGSRTISITLSHAATTRTVSKTVSVIVGVVVANSGAPVISGTLDYGNVLTCSDGTWTGTPAPTYTYQWQKNGTNISGQTASTYTSVFGDVGATITCEVTGSNPFNSVMVEATGVVILDPDAPVPVLTLIEDGLEEASPFYTFSSTAAGTLTWDFHSSATPPAAGAGDHLTGTQAVGSGITVWDTDLSAAAGETGYLHYRVTNSAGTSNILTSQVITVPSSWTPADLGADLLGWWDASNSGSLTLSGADVTGWNDLSGSGNHLTQGTATRYPQYSATSFNSSYPGLTFDGSNDVLLKSSAAGTTGNILCCFAVARLDSGGASSGRLFSYALSSDDYQSVTTGILLARNVATEALFAYRNNSALGTKAITYGSNFRAASILDGSNNTIYVNNVASTSVASTGSFGNTDTTMRIGNSFANNEGWKGTIAEVFICKVVPSDLTAIDNYFKAKWGL
jgi:hypothetical protein